MHQAYLLICELMSKYQHLNHKNTIHHILLRSAVTYAFLSLHSLYMESIQIYTQTSPGTLTVFVILHFNKPINN